MNICSLEGTKYINNLFSNKNSFHRNSTKFLGEVGAPHRHQRRHLSHRDVTVVARRR